MGEIHVPTSLMPILLLEIYGAQISTRRKKHMLHPIVFILYVIARRPERALRGFGHNNGGNLFCSQVSDPIIAVRVCLNFIRPS